MSLRNQDGKKKHVSRGKLFIGAPFALDRAASRPDVGSGKTEEGLVGVGPLSSPAGVFSRRKDRKYQAALIFTV